MWRGKEVIRSLCEGPGEVEVRAVGATGLARRLIGAMVGADVVKTR